jgi:hypothetical protein
VPLFYVVIKLIFKDKPARENNAADTSITAEAAKS